MNLYYYNASKGNFGDDLNAWLWPKLIPELLINHSDSLFIGIGTILNHRIPTEYSKIIFGAGFGYGEVPEINNKWKIYFVRGPLSTHKLKLKTDCFITDSAILLKSFSWPKETKYFKASFMPHHISSQVINWKEYSYAAGINYIDPCSRIEQVISSIRQSEILIAEAMHGAIVADVFGIPWIPVSLHSHILSFKWHDWCQSMDLSYKPATVQYALKELNHSQPLTLKKLPEILTVILNNFKPMLSNRKLLNSKYDQVMEAMAMMKKDFKLA